MEDNIPQASEETAETNVPVAPEDAAVEEQAETNATDEKIADACAGLEIGQTVRIRGGGQGYISQISADRTQVRVAEPLPDDRNKRVGKRWVPAADVERSEEV